MRIIRALVAGERDPDALAACRDVRCHSSTETIRAALTRNDRDEHIFALSQSRDLYETYQAKIAECDGKLEAAVGALTVRATDTTPLPKARFRQKPTGAPAFDVRAALHGVLGVDLTQIHGIGPSLALKLVAECGTDLTAWPSAKHFTSWLCLAPGNKNLRRQTPVVTYPPFVQSGRGPVAAASARRDPSLERLAGFQHRVHDDGQLACDGDGGALEADPLSRSFSPHVRRSLSAKARVRITMAAS